MASNLEVRTPALAARVKELFESAVELYEKLGKPDEEKRDRWGSRNRFAKGAD